MLVFLNLLPPWISIPHVKCLSSTWPVNNAGGVNRAVWSGSLKRFANAFWGVFLFPRWRVFLPRTLSDICMSPCWLSQQFTSVLQIWATGFVSSSASPLPPALKGERARSGVPSVTIVTAKPNENKVEKALEWPPGSQCLTPGVGMKNTGFSLPWEASNTSLHQNCWTDWTLRLSQEINSYFPVTASFLLKVENKPKTPRAACLAFAAGCQGPECSRCLAPGIPRHHIPTPGCSSCACWMPPSGHGPSARSPHWPPSCSLAWSPLFIHLLGNLSIYASSPLLKGKNLSWTKILYGQYAWGAGQPLSHRAGLYQERCWNFLQGTGRPLLDCYQITGRQTSKPGSKGGGAPWKQWWSLGAQEVFSRGWCLDGVSWVQREDGKVPGVEALWLQNDKVQQALGAPGLNIRRSWESIRDRRIMLHSCCSCPPLAVHLWPWLGTEWWAWRVLVWSGHLVTSSVAFRSQTASEWWFTETTSCWSPASA